MNGATGVFRLRAAAPRVGFSWCRNCNLPAALITNARPAQPPVSPLTRLQCLVGPVAERRILGALAAAQFSGFGLRDGKFFRRKPGDFVRPIAERLFLRAATGAPPVVAGCEVYGIGPF